MLIITDIKGNSEMLTDVSNVEITEERNGDFSISFTVFNTERNAHSYPLLQEESIVDLEGQEFRVKRITEVKGYKVVDAQHVFFDLIGKRKEDIFGGTRSVNDMFNWLLSDTGWTYEIVDSVPSALFANFGESNVLSLIRSACEQYECSIKIEPNKHLKVGLRVGEDKDEQFRYGYNIKTLTKSVDTTNLTTKIKGYGGNGLEVTYTSPMADIYGEIWAEPVEDDRFTIAESLVNRVKQEIQDMPDISIEIELAELGMDVSLDDGIWTIYEPLGIEYLSYITSITSYPFTNKSPVVTISNVKKTITDILTRTKIEIDENKKETRSRFEQTNEQITLAVERIGEAEAKIEIQADEISLTVKKGEIISSINQSAEAVTIEASKINLIGKVTASDIEVGNSIQLGDSTSQATKAIRFNGTDSWIYSNGSNLILSSGNSILFQSPYLDFNNATIANLNSVAKFG